MKIFLNLSYLLFFLLYPKPSESTMHSCFEQVQTFIGEFAKQERTQGLSLAGKGGGIDHDSGKVSLISVSFSIPGNIDLLKARKIAVLSLERFASELNSMSSLSDCLTPTPFPISSINFSLVKVYNGKEDSNSIVIVSIRKGRINYARNNPSDPYQSDWFHTETYEEAKQILANQTQE